MSASKVNEQWRLAAFPQGEIRPGDFEWSREPVPKTGEGQILVRNIYLSVDPTNRLWASGEETYLPALELGEVMRGITLGIVEDSRHSKFQQGDLVSGMLGWQRYALSDGEGVARLPREDRLPLTAYLGVMGTIGLTAYFGLLEIGRPSPGETVLVSAAAGAVGSLVGQIARLCGCRVVGLAGSAAKCRWIAQDLGFDAAINYHDKDIVEAIGLLCPAGVDIYFDNVGGHILDAAMGAMNRHGRIVVCGQISQYNRQTPQQTFSHMRRFLINRVRMQAFIVTDYLPRAREAMPALQQWVRDRKLIYRFDILEGLEQAPVALSRVFAGANCGKQLVQISAEPDEYLT
ncbi:MAG: NADP-dependent oxidoreductase [Steroidobacteraceae bacterium]